MPSHCAPCVVCGGQLTNVFDDAANQPADGLTFISHGHYGSTVFDPMDGQHLEINICDSCVTAAAEAGRVWTARDSRPVVTCENGRPGEVIVGRQRVQGVPRQFDPARPISHDDILRVDESEVGSDVPDVTWFQLNTQ